MAEKTHNDETMAGLRAKVKQLEAALDRERERARSAPRRGETRQRTSHSDTTDSARRVADSASSVTRRARDGASRMVRGSKLAAFEGVRAFSDSITSFADSVISRNEGSDRNVRDLITDLPGDIVSGFADAFDNFIDVPSRAADRYAQAYREGSDTPAGSRHSTRDDDEDVDDSPAPHTTHTSHDASHRTTETTTKS